MQIETLHTQLAQIVSPEAVRTQTPTIEGKQPALSVVPQSVDEFAALIAVLHDAKAATILVGGGTILDLGSPPSAADVALHTGDLDAITGYEPTDLIVTVEAGVTLAELQQTLREHDQMLPLEVPLPALATVGGALAANAHGPLRHMYGTAKDLVMGMQFVQGDGTLVKSGGEVVKNVAGFGLHKLHVGALGTLGAIALATFKVFPLPKADRSLVLSFTQADAVFAAVAAMRAHHPAAAVVGNAVAQRCLFGSERSAHVLLVRFMGAQQAVARQVRAAAQAGGEAGASAIEICDETDGAALWQQCVDVGMESGRENILFKAAAVPTELRHVYADLLRTAKSLDGSVGFIADPLNGSLRCGIQAASDQNEDSSAQAESLSHLLSFLQHARAVCQEHGGSLVLQRGPLALKKAFDVWGVEPQGLNTMRSIKQAFDPHNILNPGRFVGGI